MTSLKNRLARGFKASLLAQGVDLVAKSALIVVMARYLLTPEEYGLLHFALNVVGLLAIAGSLGLPASGARYVTEFEETDPGQVPHVLRTTFAYVVALSLVVATTVAVLHVPMAELLGQSELGPLLLIGVAYVLFRATTQYLVNAFQGLNRVDWSAVVKSTTAIAQATFAVGFVLLGLGVTGAMLGYAVGYGIAAVLGGAVMFVRFYRNYDHDPDPDDGLGRRILEYSVPLTATRGAAMLDKKVDTVLVGVLLNPLAVSFYTIGKQVSSVCIAVAGSLGFTISPAFGEQKFADDPESAARLYETAMESVLLLYVPAAVGLALVADPLVHYVFGADYAGAVVVLQVLSAYVLVNSITQITSDGLDYLGRARDRAVVKSTMAVANALLNLLLIPTIGVVGAAVATVATHTVYAAANVYIMHLELPIDLRGLVRPVGWIWLVTGAMAGGVLALLPYVSGLLTLIAVVCSGALIWALLSVAGGLIDPREVQSFLL